MAAADNATASSLGYTLADATGFVQFSLGIGAASAFRAHLLSLGVPCAVTALVLVAAWAAGGVTCARPAASASASWRLSRPAQALCMWLTHRVLLIACVVLVVAWGIATAAALKPATFGVGIVAVLPAAALVGIGVATWRGRGWRYVDVVGGGGISGGGDGGDAVGPRCGRSMLRCRAAARSATRRCNTLTACFGAGFVLLTAYELAVGA